MLFDPRAYQPGLAKLVQHLDHLKAIKEGRPVAPIHVSFWPTIRCQCACEYCCCRNEDRDQPDLSWGAFDTAFKALASRGTKAIEFAGGGEPLLWPYLPEAVRAVKQKGLKVSLITNGLALGDTDERTVRQFDWIRFSIQSVAHAQSIPLGPPPHTVRVSASHVVAEDAINQDELAALHRFMTETAMVTRIAVAQPWRSAEKVALLRSIVEELGPPFFWSHKPLGASLGCYMPWVRAAVMWTGYFLPCPSVMLTPGAIGRVLDDFKLCHVSELGEWLDTHPPKDVGFRCSFCNCGRDYNDLLHGLLGGIADADFV